MLVRRHRLPHSHLLSPRRRDGTGRLAQVVSLSLANNGLTSVLPLSPFFLTTNLPHIENVSFANNNLRRFGDLDPFSPLVGKERKDKQPKGWPKLKELVLTGNPVTASGGQVDTYAKCVVLPSNSTVTSR